MPHLQTLGFHLTPYRLRILKGRIRPRPVGTFPKPVSNDPVRQRGRGRVKYRPSKTSAGRNFTTTTSAPRSPSGKDCRIRIHSDLLRGNRKDWVVDRVQEKLGKMVRFAASVDLQVGKKGFGVSFVRKSNGSGQGEPILQIKNDYFPTAVFQRRVVALKDAEGHEWLALEENMDTARPGKHPLESGGEGGRDPGPRQVREPRRGPGTNRFLRQAKRGRQPDGEEKEDLAIIVKPNFMFMYSTKDRSTFTDPGLIEHLINRIHDQGIPQSILRRGPKHLWRFLQEPGGKKRLPRTSVFPGKLSDHRSFGGSRRIFL